MTFVLTTRTMFPSASALASALSAKSGQRIRVTTHADTRLPGPVIRWGTDALLQRGQASLNSAEFIGLASDKWYFSEKMMESGIPCVEIMNGEPDRFPIVIRRTLTGYGGAGISLCRSKDEWTRGIYWSYYRRFRPELGVHIFKGRIIKLFKKVWMGEGAEPEFPIRNASRGYHFQRVDVANYPKLVPFVTHFYDEFPIKFGRLDIGWDYDEKTYRVIEMNTAPGLVNNPDTLEAYANALLEML